MKRTPTSIAAAVVGGLGFLCVSPVVHAQVSQAGQAVGRIASLAPGSIAGVVQDEKDAPIAGATVSALGATSAFGVTDRTGHFELRRLAPGPYLVRAHLNGFIASRGQIVEVRPSGRASSALAMSHASGPSLPVLAAGVAGIVPAPPEAPAPPEVDGTVPREDSTASNTNEDHGEVAWRLRHARRGILKEATLPEELAAGNAPGYGTFDPFPRFDRPLSSSVRSAANFLSDTPISGQFNLLTASSFDTPQQLFATDTLAHGIAYVSLGAPVGQHADWNMRGALTQGDISSWILAGEYTTRGPARHRYDVGLSYSTQRYDIGSPAALSDPTDGNRNAGAVYGFDTFAITPAISLTYGGRYARYDYLGGGGLLSPRVALTLTPGEHFRINTLVSRRAVAPGAEEFLPPADGALLLPPQRTFSALVEGRHLVAERASHLDVELERDIAAATVSVRAFRQSVDDQLVTLFGIDMPDRPAARQGHYFVANSGDVQANGLSAGFRAAFARRMHGSIEYSVSRAHWSPSGDLAYVVLLAPAGHFESERIHDVASTLEANMPETATRVTVLYRVSNGFVRRDVSQDRPAFDSRFDVQVRQSLPFMDFSTARWEMLIAVRDFFREAAADQSIYDELLVSRPPKRILGGLTLHF